MIFSLPFSNSRVEQIFSSLKYLKGARRNILQMSTMNDLLEIHIEESTLKEFSADGNQNVTERKHTEASTECQEAL